MAHYAFLDTNDFVTEVITGKDENELLDGLTPEEWYGKFRNQQCVRTSYNNRIRKQFAGIGYFYDRNKDIFIAPQPYPSWVLNENSDWVPPTPMPENGNWLWDEENLCWVERENVHLP